MGLQTELGDDGGGIEGGGHRPIMSGPAHR
jgi:hypothetical protein